MEESAAGAGSDPGKTLGCSSEPGARARSKRDIESLEAGVQQAEVICRIGKDRKEKGDSRAAVSGIGSGARRCDRVCDRVRKPAGQDADRMEAIGGSGLGGTELGCCGSGNDPDHAADEDPGGHLSRGRAEGNRFPWRGCARRNSRPIHFQAACSYFEAGEEHRSAFWFMTDKASGLRRNDCQRAGFRGGPAASKRRGHWRCIRRYI
jgi:hypothetical protein